MALNQYTLSIDWNNDGDYGDTGEDVSSRLQALSWQRGRDQASQISGRSIAGRLEAVLDNRSGDYSSFNSASPLYGNLLPGRKIRLQAGEGGGFPYTFPITWRDHTEWVGYLERLEPIPSLHGDHRVRLIATGPLGRLNQRRVRLAMQTSRATGVAIGDVLDAAGWAAADRSIDTGDTTMTRWWVDEQYTINALRTVEETEGGFVYESKDGKIVFEERLHRLSSPHQTSQATFSDAAAAARSYSTLSQLDPLPFVFNDFRVSVRLYTVAGLAVLWTHPETGADSPLIAPGESKDFWSSYPNPDSATDAFAVDAWTTPVATTDYLANSASDGSGTNMTADIGVAVSKFAQAMKITLTNNTTPGAYITFLQARGTAVLSADPAWVSATDSASQTAYGERTFPTPGAFIPTSQEALDYAHYHLALSKDAVPFLELSFIANRNVTTLAEAMGRDIGDRITVVNSNLGINGAFFIEAVRHTVDAHLMHRVSWLLSDAVKFSDFWVLDTSALDTQTRLAY